MEHKNITPKDALEKLKCGNKNFFEDKFDVTSVDSHRRDELVTGQNPFATIISCSDSRVAPEIIFNVGLGDIFDIRIAGNIIDDDVLGSLEYAIEELQTPVLLILGHQSCGAVTAAHEWKLTGNEPHAHIKGLIERILPSIEDNKTIDECVINNTLKSYNEVIEDEMIKNAISSGKLMVVPAYYDFDGKVFFLDN